MHKVIKSVQPGSVIGQYELKNSIEALELQREQERLEKEMASIPPEERRDRVETSLKMAEDILNVAREEAEKLKADAYKKGYEAGVKDGREDGYWQAYNENAQKFREDRDEALDSVEQCLSDMEAKKQELLDRHLEELKDISVAVAEKVMHISLKSSGDIIKRMIIAATEKLKKSEWAKIYISKYDADLTMQGDAQLLNSLSFLSDNIKIIVMDREQSGTCIIELPKEIIDISVDAQMENIKEILNNAQL